MVKNMNKLISLTINDLRNIMRDSVLRYFLLVVPFLFIAMLIWLIPFLIGEFPIISNYTDVIISFFLLELPLIIGFIISFMMLDEKDERVFTALRVMPVSLFQFLFYRLFFAVFFSFVFVFIMLFFNNIYDISLANILINAFLFALITPIVVLLEVTFAANKVTGFTLFKGINFILMIPIAAFFIPSDWKILLGIIPSYWPMHSIYSVLNNTINISLPLISLSYTILLTFLLSLIFKRKVYNI